jgi:ABC-type antimicrobial peptide transport system permease subunit
MTLSYRLARASLKAHRLRTYLTVLGVVIGVFIISLILIVSGSLRRGITNQISSLNDSVVIVRGSTTASTGLEAFSPLSIAPITTLTSRDSSDIEKLPSVESTAPMMFIGGTVSGSNGEFNNVTVVATTPIFPKVFQVKIASGNWFDENETSQSWVILGNKLASGLLGTTEPTGQVVTIKGQSFTVIGVLAAVNQPISLAGTDIDKTAFLSIQNGVKFSGTEQVQIGQIAVRAESSQTIPDLKDAITSQLQKQHVDDNDFSVTTGDNATGSLSNWLNTITLAALFFASISLVVGGIGIMNIMLVSVTERIHEIGIRKAIGATKRHILGQFLVEALLMTLYGGIFGLALAYLAGYVVSVQFSLPLVYDWWIFAIGLGVPLSIGIVFGLWPAIRAARQDPIVALKQIN